MTVSDTLTKKKELSKEEINILNTFRINDLAKNQVIDTLIKYISQDSIMISKLQEKTTLLESDKITLKNIVVEKDQTITKISGENSTLHRKLKRTRKIGIASSVLFGILGSVLTIIYT